MWLSEASFWQRTLSGVPPADTPWAQRPWKTLGAPFIQSITRTPHRPHDRHRERTRTPSFSPDRQSLSGPPTSTTLSLCFRPIETRNHRGDLVELRGCLLQILLEESAIPDLDARTDTGDGDVPLEMSMLAKMRRNQDPPLAVEATLDGTRHDEALVGLHLGRELRGRGQLIFAYFMGKLSSSGPMVISRWQLVQVQT